LAFGLLVVRVGAAPPGPPAVEPPSARVCLKSFPWGAGGFDGEKFRRLTAADMGRIREHVHSLIRRYEARDPLLRTELPAHDLAFIEQLNVGLDPDQVRLFADFFWMQRLSAERRHKEVLEVSSAVARRYGRPMAAYRPDKVELETTYYARPSLLLLIRQYHHRALIGGASHDADKVIKLIAAYLDEWNAFAPFGAVTATVHTKILSTLEDIEPEAIAKHPDVTIVSRTAGVLTFTLRGKKTHTIALSPEGVRLVKTAD
jgi:hypothetical protein